MKKLTDAGFTKKQVAVFTKNLTKKRAYEEKPLAILTINEFPRTSDSNKRMYKWLTEKANEIKSLDPHLYAEPCRFRLF